MLSNWETQISEHTQPGVLKLIVFHGDGRQESQSALEEADVVVTTYNVLSSELSKKVGPISKKKGRGSKGSLLDTNWKRVVLDEGQTIRNAKAGSAVWYLLEIYADTC